DPVDYPAGGGDDGDDEEGSLEDDEDDDMDIEADEEEEEEEHPAPADSVVVALPAADHALFAEETESFETDDSAAKPSQHPAYRMTARISIPAPVPIPAWSDLEDRPEVTLPPWKRLGIALGPGYEVGESSYAAAARPAGGLKVDYDFFAIMDRESKRDPKREVGYGITDSWDEIDMSWTGLHEFKDDTVTDYSRPSPTIESSSDDAQNRNPSVTATEASPSTISPKPFIKFVKPADSPTVVKTKKKETVRKPSIKYVELYKKPSKKSTIRGNQRNWNNLKSHQLG
nr:hypothetical protein [Tanacetum cinerariifolium]